MQASEGRTGDINVLGEKIEGIRIAMMTTVEDDGTLHSRPMAATDAQFDGNLWFFTLASAPKVEEVEHDRHVSVSYARPEDDLYISVAGTAQLVRDRARVQELWQPSLQAWFPRGLDDPDLALLRVQVRRAEYWDASSSTKVSPQPGG